MSSDDRVKRPETEEPGGAHASRGYHRPHFEDYGDARDLTRSNPGAGPDGAFFDGADAGLDGAGTAS
jgi:hypothetical protein